MANTTYSSTPNKAFWRALHSLVHPLTIASVIILIINDHIWKHHYATWWTGKLSDVVGLVFAPFLAAIVLAILIPPSHPRQEHIVIIGSIGLTGLIFALSNTLPLAHDLTEKFWAIFVGESVVIWRDPTDLYALPALLISWQIWRHASSSSPRIPIPQYAMLIISAFATMATSCGDITDIGIGCIYASNNELLAIQYHNISYDNLNYG